MAESKALVISYVPMGEDKPLELTMDRVIKFLARPTKNGVWPTSEDIVRFMMLCQAKQLNPWVDDAYLLGYDTRDGAKFSLITAHQAILKRGEVSPNYDGMESGVVIMQRNEDDTKTIVQREGDLVYEGESLIGGWAAVYRTDRTHRSYDSLKLQTFDTGQSRWKKDPAGMIVKCAEASAMRKAFPSQTGGLYNQEEMKSITETANTQSDSQVAASKVLDQFPAPAKPKKKPAAIAKQEVEAAAPIMDEVRGKFAEACSEKLVKEFTEPTEAEMAAVESEEAYQEWLGEVRQARTQEALDTILGLAANSVTETQLADLNIAATSRSVALGKENQ